MKSKLIKEKKKNVFPKLMKSQNGIVLMTEDAIGVVLYINDDCHPNCDWITGEIHIKFRMDFFTNYNGSIVLSND